MGAACSTTTTGVADEPRDQLADVHEPAGMLAAVVAAAEEEEEGTLFVEEVVVEGEDKGALGPPLLRQPYMPELHRASSEEIREAWLPALPAAKTQGQQQQDWDGGNGVGFFDVYGPLAPGAPEYARAAEMVCLPLKYAATSSLVQAVRTMQAQADAQPLETPDAFQELLALSIQRAYNLESRVAAQNQHDLMTGHNIYNVVCNAFAQSAAWRKPLMARALAVLSSLAPADAIMAKLGEVCDRATRCSSAQRQAFNVLVVAAHNLVYMRTNRSGPDTNTDANANLLRKRARAHLHVHQCFSDFLDDHKERAFTTAFTTPAQLYGELVGDHCLRDHVDIHAVNFYLSLVQAALGMQLHIDGELHDGCGLGLCDHWAALTDSAWELLSEREHFGKAMQGVSELRGSKKDKFLRKRVPHGQFPEGLGHGSAMNVGHAAVAPTGSGGASPEQRQSFAVYLERFAHFFTRPFLLPVAFETLNAEAKPEHSGFSKSMAILFEHFCESCLDMEEPCALVDWVYRDDMYTELDIDRLGEFFEWLGLVRPLPGRPHRARFSSSQQTEKKEEQQQQQEEEQADEGATKVATGQAQDQTQAEAEDGEEGPTCPICFEVVPESELQPLPHWGGEDAVRGDISEHVMCNSCRDAYKGSDCPFCRTLLSRETANDFVTGFVSMVRDRSQHGDPHQRAAVTEHWQLLEMEHAMRPQVIRHIAVMVLTHTDFWPLLQQGVHSRADWLRDTAGILFRFHSMFEEQQAEEGSASNAGHLPPEVVDAVRSAVEEGILGPLECTPPQQLHPHFYGSIYAQAVAAWLGAQCAGDATQALTALVQRTGRAVVHCYTHACGSSDQARREVCERIPNEYFEATHDAVWGGQANDEVWRTFVQ